MYVYNCIYTFIKHYISISYIIFYNIHYICEIQYNITLWLFNIAMGNGPLIDGLPIKNGDFPWLR
jgi:hypothetical protein